MEILVQTIIVITTLMISFVAMNLVDYLCFRAKINDYLLSLIGAIIALVILVPVTLTLFM